MIPDGMPLFAQVPNPDPFYLIAIIVLTEVKLEEHTALIVGNMVAWPGMVVAYYFGTTKSSADKNKIIANGKK